MSIADMIQRDPMEFFLQDIRSALRLMARRPAFTGISLFTLALGIGANTAIFSVVSAVMLRGLPFEDPDRLVQLVGTSTRESAGFGEISYPDFRDWEEQNEVFEHLAAIEFAAVSVAGTDRTEHVEAGFVSPSYFRVLGSRRPVVGRQIAAEDDCVCPPVAVVSHRLWERTLASDSGVVGRSIVLNGVAAAVVGIMGADFVGVGGEVDVWLPLLSSVAIRADRSVEMFEERDQRFLSVIARLEPSASLDDARRNVDLVVARLREEFPATNAEFGTVVVPLEERLLGDAHGAAVLLLVAVGLVLLIACANVANLRVARDTARHKEIALRHALGASRRRMIRYLVTESVAIAVMGGALGLIVALWLTDLLAIMNPVELPEFVGIALNPGAIVFAFVLSVLTGVVFGVLPALRVTDARAADTLRNAARGAGHTSKSAGLLNTRSVIVVAQVSLALVVLIAAGLMIRTLSKQMDIDPGIDGDNLLTLSIQLPPRRYADGGVRRFAEGVVEAIGGLPTVESVAMTSTLPLAGRYESVKVRHGDALSSETAESMPVYRHRVTPGYFTTMGIPVAVGREFSFMDDRGHPGVVIVSEAMARRAWPGEDVLGKRIVVDGDEETSHAVVGVVGNVKHRGLIEGATQGAEAPDVYFPLYQDPTSRLDVAVRASQQPTLLIESIRREIRSMDRNVAVFNIATFDELIGEDVAVSRLASMQLGSYGLLALTLAAVGLYGVVSHTVTRRMNEISVRVALGASPNSVIFLVLRQGAWLIVFGVAAGIVGAFGATRVIAHRLYGVSATDLPTYVAVTVVLTAVGLLACLVPARRATKVDPIKALKQE
ncbi:MAG: ABC transporter permease [Gemmatimonadetes bacterium]|nr:ABC transporter permease [Gemmatimonadota bacterium]